MIRCVAMALGAFALLVASGQLACVHPSTDTLQIAVNSYNDSLRWKRFPHAASFLPIAQRGAFLARYLEAEEDLHIQSIEVRTVDPLPGQETPTALVTVVAESYLLPSTVVQRTVIQQRWQLIDDQWILQESSKELAPPLDPEKTTGHNEQSTPQDL